MLTMLTSIAAASAAKNLTMNSSTAERMLTDWSMTFGSLLHAEWHFGVDRLRFRLERFAELEAVAPSRMTTPSSKVGSPLLRMR